MSEPSPILVLMAFEWRAMCRLAAKGEAWAREQIENLFDAYRDQNLVCYLCQCAVDWPPVAQVIPQRSDPSRLDAAALCQHCAELPAIVRYNRVASSKAYFQQSRRVARA